MKNRNYTDIKTFDDALKATNRLKVPEFLDVPEDMREYFKAQYRAAVITEAINGDWKADWTDRHHRKFILSFYFSFLGFRVEDPIYGCISTNVGNASRLCFETEEQAKYAGKTFKDIYEKLLTK